MDDLISRRAAIDAVKRLSLGETDATRLAMRIGDYLERLPSAPQWHLMSETPEIENDYLVTLRGAYGRNWIEMASYNRDDGWIVWSKDLDVIDCIAWMELPEPYEEEQNGKKIHH